MKTSKVAVAICLGLALCGLSAGASSAGTDAGIEVGFSPDGSGEALVLRSISSARQSIRLAAYSFTAAPVARALVDAKKRGVDVAVVVDYKNNLAEDRSGKARAALNLLVNAGIPTRTVSAFPMQHSKYAVIDGAHVQTGSYNYSVAAARYNSENVLVVLNRPDLARQYLDNWQRLYNASQAFTSTY
jgi:phosphatidylserine/phosphatidylglycerophosphate/cardiolipin synthase-like enzyme